MFILFIPSGDFLERTWKTGARSSSPPSSSSPLLRIRISKNCRRTEPTEPTNRSEVKWGTNECTCTHYSPRMQSMYMYSGSECLCSSRRLSCIRSLSLSLSLSLFTNKSPFLPRNIFNLPKNDVLRHTFFINYSFHLSNTTMMMMMLAIDLCKLHTLNTYGSPG